MRVARSWALGALLVGGACAGDEAVCPAGTTQILAGATLTGDLFLRDGAAPWRPVADGEPVCVHDDYAVLSACRSDDGRALVAELRATAGEEVGFNGECGASGDDEGRVDVSGRVRGAGLVQVGEVGVGQASPTWDFVLRPKPGVVDVIAGNRYYVRPEEARLVVLRDVRVSSPVSLPEIDLSQGALLEQLDVDVRGAEPDDDISTETYLTSANRTRASIGAARGAVALGAPASLRRPSDVESVMVLARASSFARTAVATLSDATPVVELPPRFEGVTFDASGNPAARWAELPVSDYKIMLFVAWGSAGTRYVTASQRWILAHGGHEIGVDDSAFEDPAAWSLGTPRGIDLSVAASQVFGTSVSWTPPTLVDSP